MEVFYWKSGKMLLERKNFTEISSLGRIRNKITKNILKPSKSGKYRHIQLKYGINQKCANT